MSVNSVRRNKAADAIAKRMVERLGDLHQLEINAETGALLCLPTYAITNQNLLSERWKKGWRSGFFYAFVDRNNNYGVTVDIAKPTGADPPVFLRGFVGTQAGRVQDLFKQACDQYNNDLRSMRPRHLQLPWLGMSAIWLNSNDPDDNDGFLGIWPELNDEAFLNEAYKRAKAFKP